MIKLKDWLRYKISKFLNIYELENSIYNNNKEIGFELKRLNSTIKQNEYNTDVMYKGLKKDISHFQESVNTLHTTVENVVHIGTDVHENHSNSSHSWAVVCIEGKINLIKFVDLGRNDARYVFDFLKQFEASRHCIDTPHLAFFKDGLFKF